MVCTFIHLIEMSSKRRQNMLLTSVPYKIIPNKTKKPALRQQWSILQFDERYLKHISMV